MKGYGFADLDARIPVDINTTFDLASVSKQMTAMATMMLIAEGKIAEDTPLSDVLPAFDGRDSGERPLVVSDLVHHVSGLPDYLNDNAFGYQDSTGNAEIIDWLAKAPLARAPGTEFEYSNSGYITLGSLVAAADEAKSLSDVLHRRIWDVLRMTSTGLVTPADPKALARGYAGSDGDFTSSEEKTMTEGDGNVYSSVADLALYENALATNKLLMTEATVGLFTYGLLDNGSPITQQDGAGYGFGWNIDSWNGSSIAYHDGSWYGTATAYLRYLDNGLSVIVLSNGEDLDTVSLASEIAAAVD
jgi:CubicO group peptidase (beta-lactamase class C family)